MPNTERGKIFIAHHVGQPIILQRAFHGMLDTFNSDFPLFRVAYVPNRDALEAQAFDLAATKISAPYPLLFMTGRSPDGPPNRTGVLFSFERKADENWLRGGHPKPITVEVYRATRPNDSFGWEDDGRVGPFGYFLFGTSRANDLWRVSRMEVDFAGQRLFTVVPLRLATGIPALDLSKIENAAIRQKLEDDWLELQNCAVRHIYSGLITTARNIAECVVISALSSSPAPLKLSLNDGLRQIRAAIEAKRLLRFPLTELDYVLMTKIRILHARSHADRVISEGRLTEPELALTVLPDIVQVMRSAGLVHDPA